MPYKIKLSNAAAPITVERREDVEKIVAVFDRLRKAKVVARPFFVFPIQRERAPKVGEVMPQPEILQLTAPPAADVEANYNKAIGTKDTALLALAAALKRAKEVEAGSGIYNGGKWAPRPKPILIVALGGAKEEYPAEAEEAEAILSLIAEYRALP